MEQLATVRLELGINAQRIISMLQTNNQQLEKQVEAGIQMALDEIANTDNFVLMIKNKTIEAISAVILRSVTDWEIQNKIKKAIDEKVESKIQEFSSKVAESIMRGINISDIKIEP